MNIFKPTITTFLCPIFLLAFFFNYSQNETTVNCGTNSTLQSQEYLSILKPKLKLYETGFLETYYNKTNKNSTKNKFNTPIINSIPIKAHIIRSSNGSGGFSASELESAISNLNNMFADAHMEFFICDGINYINEDTLSHFKKGDEKLLTEKFNVSGLINIYFTNNIKNTNDESICGYTDNTGRNDVIVMKNDCATNNSSLAHEIGHFFSLVHTHGLDNAASKELVDGSNCDTDGDGICDTPADPKLTDKSVNNFCEYIGAEKDTHGKTFSPDVNNIMSYSKKGCRNSFTPQQLARMNAFYHTTKNYLACPSFNANFSVDVSETCNENLTVNFNANCENITKWEWDMNADGITDYTTQNPTHTFTKGIYDVLLTVSNKTKTINKRYVNAVKVGNELKSSNEDFEDFDMISNHGWTLKDTSRNGYNWFLNSGTTASTETGPLTDHTKKNYKGHYLYAEASGAKIGDVAEFISPCITVENINTELHFAYHMFGKNMGELHIDIITETDIIKDAVPAIYGSQQAKQADDFKIKKVDLSAFKNKTIKVCFRAVRGASWDADIAIDDISINTDTQTNIQDQVLVAKVFPNPISGDTIYVKTEVSEILNYSISNIYGQIFASGNIQNQAIQVNHLSSGTYLLTLSNGTSKVVKKIIK